jgi:hypothetical protein
MRRLIEKAPDNANRIFPYIGGEEVNNDPEQRHHRYVIDFVDFPLQRRPMATPWAAMDAQERDAALRDGAVPTDYPNPVAADWPDLLAIIERLVRPQRALDNRPARRERWWRFGDRQPGLYSAITRLSKVLANSSKAAPQFSIAFLPPDKIYS